MTQSVNQSLATFFQGAKVFQAEPVFASQGSISIEIDANTKVISTKYGRALSIANPNGEGSIIANMADDVPMKESYTVTKLVAIRDWDERNIKKGHITFKAE